MTNIFEFVDIGYLVIELLDIKSIFGLRYLNKSIKELVESMSIYKQCVDIKNRGKKSNQRALQNIFLTACKFGYYKLVDNISTNYLNKVQNLMTEALYIASCNDHWSIVYYLGNIGVDVNHKLNHAFAIVCQRGRLDMVKYLLRKGADINAMPWGTIDY